MKTMIYLLTGAFLWTSCKNMISSGQSGENTESIVTQETMLIDSLEKKLIASDNELEHINLIFNVLKYTCDTFWPSFKKHAG